MSLIEINDCFLNDDSMVLYEPMTFQEFKSILGIESNQYKNLEKGFHVNINDTNLFIPAIDAYRFLDLPDKFKDYCGEI